MQTFFGGLIGKPYGHVQAMATAWASNEGPTPNCLKPFLIPDMWFESDKATQDKNNNNYMEPDATANGNGNGQDGGEQWYYEPWPAGDYYAPFDPTVASPPQPQTGYGSGFARGIPVTWGSRSSSSRRPAERTQRQGNRTSLLDGDRAEPPARRSSPAASMPASATRRTLDRAARPGQAKQGMNYLINQDPGRHLEPGDQDRSRTRPIADWTQSPRVIIVGLIDPIYWPGHQHEREAGPRVHVHATSRESSCETTPGNTDNIKAVFLGLAPGGAGGPDCADHWSAGFS